MSSEEMFELLVTVKSQCTYKQLVDTLKMMAQDDTTLDVHEAFDKLLNKENKVLLSSEKYIMSIERYYPL